MNRESERRGGIDVSRITIPGVLAVSLIPFVIWMTASYYSERNRIDQKIDQLSNSLEQLANSLQALGESIIVRSSDRWTKTDMTVWCLQAQALNKAFKCPAVESTTPPEKTEELGRSLVTGAKRAKPRKAEPDAEPFKMPWQ